ncbi:hypothetical protein ACJ6WF_03250 [Streptomyces sp. MMS24-I2-30]|uniref:hypothetical protein n=1 Tax=Streptomyces sp. MMS24-I2-30 TaxID=3351564 RepID=UPI003896B8DC
MSGPAPASASPGGGSSEAADAIRRRLAGHGRYLRGPYGSNTHGRYRPDDDAVPPVRQRGTARAAGTQRTA